MRLIEMSDEGPTMTVVKVMVVELDRSTSEAVSMMARVAIAIRDMRGGDRR